MPSEATGDRVRRYRRLRRLSQAQLAERAGTDKGYISRLEAGGIGQPSIDVLERIAAGLEVPIRYIADPRLYEGEPEMDWESALQTRLIREGVTEDEAAATVAAVRQLLARKSA